MAGDRDMMNLLVHGDDDFSFAIPGVSRFRVSAYKQRGALLPYHDMLYRIN